MSTDFPPYLTETWLDNFVTLALAEDLGEGDHTTLSTVPASAKRSAKCIAKESGVVAGLVLAEEIFGRVSPELKMEPMCKDGEHVLEGELVFSVEGPAQAILSAERLVLNTMQRMSGIATYTSMMVSLIRNEKTKVLDTRKTTPTIRPLEKWAVLIGGGVNHRMGLYDLIMIKDNHIDYAGSVEGAIQRAKDYRQEKGLAIDIEVEARTLEEVSQIVAAGGVKTILLDNMDLATLREALQIVDGKCITEASGGVNERSIGPISETGVDFISVGALTHSYKSLDLSLKAL